MLNSYLAFEKPLKKQFSNYAKRQAKIQIQRIFFVIAIVVKEENKEFDAVIVKEENEEFDAVVVNSVINSVVNNSVLRQESILGYFW